VADDHLEIHRDAGGGLVGVVAQHQRSDAAFEGLSSPAVPCGTRLEMQGTRRRPGRRRVAAATQKERES
jgi:hypothetical protein